LKVTAPSLGKAGRTVIAASNKVKSSSQVARVENGYIIVPSAGSSSSRQRSVEHSA
jgi:hypothetical protein